MARPMFRLAPVTNAVRAWSLIGGPPARGR
jgi:hypothetical protein